MNTQPDLFPETLLVTREGDRLFTTSLKVAEHFHKRHTHVLDSVQKIIADLADDEFSEPNFRLTEYPDRRGKLHKMFELSHNGFALLAMGFTGKEAMQWKKNFLAAFRDMERQLHALKEREAQALYLLRPRWHPILENPQMRRKQLIALTGHQSEGSITACRRRMRQVGLLEG